jgi:hypothetical protein
MKDRLKIQLAVLLMAAIFIGVAVWINLQWKECRSMGFSTFYCIQHVM